VSGPDRDLIFVWSLSSGPVMPQAAGPASVCLAAPQDRGPGGGGGYRASATALLLASVELFPVDVARPRQ
jgi:hypothetical protein